MLVLRYQLQVLEYFDYNFNNDRYRRKCQHLLIRHMFLLHQNNVYIKKTLHLPSALIASSKRFDRDVSPVVL